MAVNLHIYRKLPCKWTYAANLQENTAIHCPYFGKYGLTLPAKSAETAPQRVLLRHPKNFRKRTQLAKKLKDDAPTIAGAIDLSAAKITYGTFNEVYADLHPAT